MDDMTSSAASQPCSIAVLGLGRMGTAVARRLTDRGHRVVGWTRSGRPAPGLTTTLDARAAVADADVVVLCLFDGAACREVVGRLGDRLAATTIVNTSTVGPDEAQSLAAEIQAAGGAYVHAPCIGSVSDVAGGTVTLLVSGQYDDNTAAVLADLGNVLPFDEYSTAASAKLLANGVLGGTLLLLRDLRRHAADLAIDVDRIWTVLEETPPGGLVRRKRERLDSGKFGDADFAIGALAKDLSLLARFAPGTTGLHEQVARALDDGTVHSDDDVAALLVDVPAAGCEDLHGLTVAPTVVVPPEVLEPLRAYVAGHATGDPAHHRRAFLTGAHIEGLRDERFVSWTVDEYCALFQGEPAPDEEQRRRRIDHVEVTDTVGTARMTLWHGQSTFTDVFLLVKVDGEWRIANKTYHHSMA
jgi:3-hydroxyisobutyrate dehydrogenase